MSLSDSGNIIAIGQTGDPSNLNPSDTGRVKVYQFVGGQWQQLGNTIFGDVGQDEFGFKVSLSAAGNILAIGTFGKGEVKVFELISGVWTQIGNTLFGNNPDDDFGFSLSLSSNGTILAVGARFITWQTINPVVLSYSKTKEATGSLSVVQLLALQWQIRLDTQYPFLRMEPKLLLVLY